PRRERRTRTLTWEGRALSNYGIAETVDRRKSDQPHPRTRASSPTITRKVTTAPPEIPAVIRYFRAYAQSVRNTLRFKKAAAPPSAPPIAPPRKSRTSGSAAQM